MTEPAFLTATEAVRRLRRGELSSVGLLQHLVARKGTELSADEKTYLLAAERGDIATVRRYLE